MEVTLPKRILSLMNGISLGPFIISNRSVAVAPQPGQRPDLFPLELELEWANAQRSCRLPLFRHRPDKNKEHLRLQQIVCPATQLPCDVRCQEYQVVTSHGEEFVPLEAVLVSLYGQSRISRPIFAVLADLAALVPLHSSSSLSNAPKDPEGLLQEKVEARGFRITNIISDEGCTFVDVGWVTGSTRFHTCIFVFSAGNEKLAPEEPRPSPMIGVHHLLALEIQRLGIRPEELLTDKGRQLLRQSQPAG